MTEALTARIQRTCAPVVPHVHWFVRLGLAGIFLYHGIDKLAAGTPPAEALDMMFLGSAAVFWMVAVAEVLAGVAVLAGGFPIPFSDLLTRLGGLAIAVVMLGAAFIVHLPEWHFMRGGAEFQVLTAGLGLYLAVRGNA